MPGEETPFDALLETLKKVAGLLRDAEVPFLLGGGLAVWARGGPQTEHDVDLYLREEDADRALEALAAAGFRTERPPEGWLVKAYGDEGTLVDLIFEPSGGKIGDEEFERAEELEVVALRIKVASLEDVLTQKLLSLKEQEPDFSAVLEIGRAVREQIDWDEVRERTSESPFARAYFTLVEGLNILPTAHSRD